MTDHKAALEALLDYEQADADGVMVLASREAIHVVADALAAPDDGWIPVSERLPEQHGYYLCVIDVTPLNWAEGRKAPYRQEVFWYPLGFSGTQNGTGRDVEYWRELPPPPKDKSDG